MWYGVASLLTLHMIGRTATTRPKVEPLVIVCFQQFLVHAMPGTTPGAATPCGVRSGSIDGRAGSLRPRSGSVERERRRRGLRATDRLRPRDGRIAAARVQMSVSGTHRPPAGCSGLERKAGPSAESGVGSTWRSGSTVQPGCSGRRRRCLECVAVSTGNVAVRERDGPAAPVPAVLR